MTLCSSASAIAALHCEGSVGLGPEVNSAVMLRIVLNLKKQDLDPATQGEQHRGDAGLLNPIELSHEKAWDSP